MFNHCLVHGRVRVQSERKLGRKETPLHVRLTIARHHTRRIHQVLIPVHIRLKRQHRHERYILFGRRSRPFQPIRVRTHLLNHRIPELFRATLLNSVCHVCISEKLCHVTNKLAHMLRKLPLELNIARHFQTLGCNSLTIAVTHLTQVLVNILRVPTRNRLLEESHPLSQLRRLRLGQRPDMCSIICPKQSIIDRRLKVRAEQTGSATEVRVPAHPRLLTLNILPRSPHFW